MGKRIKKAMFGDMVLENAKPVGDYILEIMQDNLVKFTVSFDSTDTGLIVSHITEFDVPDYEKIYFGKVVPKIKDLLDKLEIAHLLTIHDTIQQIADLSEFSPTWFYEEKPQGQDGVTLVKQYVYNSWGTTVHKELIEGWESLVGTLFDREDHDEIIFVV